MDKKLPIEMLQSIGRFLKKSDLNVCTQVSKRWQAAYTPLLWCELKIPGHSYQLPPSADALQKHKDLVRTLTVHDTLLHNCAENVVPAQFPNLQSLTVKDSSMDASTEASTYASTSTWTTTDASTDGSTDEVVEGDSLPFVPEQPFGVLLQLKRLNLDNIQPSKIAWFLEPISQFTHLRSLVITETKIDREGALNLWNAFPQLETLKLIEVDFLDLDAARAQMSTMQCPRLANLHLHIRDNAIPIGDQLLLIRACSALTDFQWINVEGGEDYPSGDDFDEYRQGVVPDELDKVEELEVAGSTLSDTSIALAINTMPRTRSLILAKNELRPLSFQALQPHLATLCRFDVQSLDMSSGMIQTILCSCPVLQSLRAGVMTARDAIAEDKDWACMSTLKVLSLSFRFERHEAHLQDTLFARLARLTELEQLIMHEPCNEVEGNFGLRLSLGQGFGRLSTLTAMKFLSTIDDETQTLGAEEIEWMRLNWPDLRTFCSYTSREGSV